MTIGGRNEKKMSRIKLDFQWPGLEVATSESLSSLPPKQLQQFLKTDSKTVGEEEKKSSIKFGTVDRAQLTQDGCQQRL